MPRKTRLCEGIPPDYSALGTGTPSPLPGQLQQQPRWQRKRARSGPGGTLTSPPTPQLVPSSAETPGLSWPLLSPVLPQPSSSQGALTPAHHCCPTAAPSLGARMAAPPEHQAANRATPRALPARGSLSPLPSTPLQLQHTGLRLFYKYIPANFKMSPPKASSSAHKRKQKKPCISAFFKKAAGQVPLLGEEHGAVLLCGAQRRKAQLQPGDIAHRHHSTGTYSTGP